MDAAKPADPTPPITRTALLVMLAIGPEERHGYAIMREVARLTDGATKLGPGGVYTTIRRLLDDGLIEESDDRPDPAVDDQRTALLPADRPGPRRRCCRNSSVGSPRAIRPPVGARGDLNGQ